MITRILSLRQFLRPFQCSLGRRLSVADIELLGPIERHRRSGSLSPWIVHDRPDRPGSLPLLRKYLRWVIDYTGIEYPEILFEPPARAPLLSTVLRADARRSSSRRLSKNLLR